MRRWPLAAAVLVPAALVGCAVSGLGGAGLLYLLPALLLGCLLYARLYPGESVLLRWAGTRPRRSGRPAEQRAGCPRRAMEAPRGGLLMGFSLAVRPPPCSPASS